MKTCLIYGNCQADALKIYFSKIPSFTKSYKILELKPVHLLDISSVSNLENYAQTLDLFIHQPISDNYKGISQLSTKYIKTILPKSCQTISFPVCYFTGYNPEMIALKNTHGKTINKPYSYYNINILEDYINNKPILETLDSFSNPKFYSKNEAKTNVLSSLKSLKQRELTLDIKLSEYILKYYKQEKLFHTFNHPSSTLMHYLCKTILGLIHDLDSEIFNELPDRVLKLEMLGQNQFPIYTSLMKHLQFKFEPSLSYIVKKETITIKDYIKATFDFYQKNHSVVEFNKQLHHIITQ